MSEPLAARRAAPHACEASCGVECPSVRPVGGEERLGDRRPRSVSQRGRMTGAAVVHAAMKGADTARDGTRGSGHQAQGIKRRERVRPEPNGSGLTQSHTRRKNQ